MQPFHVHRQLCISGGGAILCHGKSATTQAKSRVFWSVKPFIQKNVVAERAAVPSKESVYRRSHIRYHNYSFEADKIFRIVISCCGMLSVKVSILIFL